MEKQEWKERLAIADGTTIIYSGSHALLNPGLLPWESSSCAISISSRQQVGHHPGGRAPVTSSLEPMLRSNWHPFPGGCQAAPELAAKLYSVQRFGRLGKE